MKEVYDLTELSNDHHEPRSRYHTRSSSSKQNHSEREDCENTAVMLRKQTDLAMNDEREGQDAKSVPQGINSSIDNTSHKDRVPAELDRQLSLPDQAHRELRLENQDLTQWKCAAQKEMQELLEKNAVLQQTLQICRDDLFKLQPPTQTADSELGQTLEALNRSISGWIDNEISNYEKSWPKNQGVPPLHPFLSGGIPGAEDLLKIHPKTGEYLIQRSIYVFLQKEVFHESVDLCGLSPGSAVMVKALKASMGKLQPPRGKP